MFFVVLFFVRVLSGIAAALNPKQQFLVGNGGTGYTEMIDGLQRGF